MTLFSLILLSLLSTTMIFLLVYQLLFGLKFLKVIKEINDKMTDLTVSYHKTEAKNDKEHKELRKDIEELTCRVNNYDKVLSKLV